MKPLKRLLRNLIANIKSKRWNHFNVFSDRINKIDKIF